MRVKEYPVLVDCVERGVAHGINRAYKHTDNPSHEFIKQQIADAVMSEICEYFNFKEEHNE